MEIHLKELRKRAGLSQDAVSERLGIKTSRYGTWERGDRMMSLEQAYNCAVVLGCTIDEIAGLRHDSISGLTERESELVSLYRNCTSDRQRRTLDDLRDRAAMSGEVEDLAPQALPTRERLSA